jgi:general secretion pathway protein H
VTNRSVVFTLDLANRAYRWGQSPQQALSPDLRLSLLTSRELLAPTGSSGFVRFDPDGGSSGGRVTIEGGGVVWWVGIDWLSGRVSIEQEPR